MRSIRPPLRSSAYERCRDAETPRRPGQGLVGGRETKSLRIRDRQVKSIKCPQRGRESAQPTASDVVVTPLNRDACIHRRLKMSEKLLADSPGIGGEHLPGAHVKVVNARVKSSNWGTELHAGPWTTFEVDGVQYLAVATATGGGTAHRIGMLLTPELRVHESNVLYVFSKQHWPTHCCSRRPTSIIESFGDRLDHYRFGLSCINRGGRPNPAVDLDLYYVYPATALIGSLAYA